MEDSINSQKTVGKGTWLECFTGQPSGIPRLLYRTLLGCALQFFQQWTGVNYFFCKFNFYLFSEGSDTTAPGATGLKAPF
jgi:hypothetical protein